jgi:calcineurin-like phosphoesterase family protein
MRNIWVTSDTHFSHENIIKYCDRPFDNAAAMDEALIDYWNEVVKPGDLVYHLGDVCFGDYKEVHNKIWTRLNGKKRIVVGNHDDIPFLVKLGFAQKIVMWRMFPEFGLLFTHVPVDPSGLKIFVGESENKCGTEQKRFRNVHGHIHQNPSPTPDHYNVCVEQTNYRPVNIEELRIR